MKFRLSTAGTVVASAIGLLATGVTCAQVPAATPPNNPPEAVGNEASAAQIAHARAEGDAYGRKVRWEREGAAWSGDVRAGDFHLTAAISPGEGGWDLTPSGLRWSDPRPGNIHLRVFAADGGDGRFVPGAVLHAAVFDAAGKPLLETDLPGGIYPLTDAYGADIAWPAGAATLAVTVEPLAWRRHDPYNGDRYRRAASAVLSLAGLGPVGGEPASARAERAPAALKADADRALQSTIDAMYRQANDGAQKRSGDYEIVYAVEYGEAYWEFREGEFRYTIENEKSARYNAHVEVGPIDAFTGNFLGGVQVSAVVVGPDGPVPPPPDSGGMGSPTKPGDVPLMWHSWLYHYGQNWRVPSAGSYGLRIHVDAPKQRRYGKASGQRMAEPVDVTFENVTIKTGQK